MKNWKEIYEDYKTAASKPSIFDPKYDDYLKKIESLERQGNAVWNHAFDELTNEYVLFKGRSFYFRHINTDFGDSLYWAGVLEYFESGDVEKAKEGLSRRLVKELGTEVMNHSDSLMDVKKGCLGIEMVLAKVDKDLCDKVRNIMTESRKLHNRAAEMKNAKERRFYAPRNLWSEMLIAWADQELYVVGAEVYGYGKVAKVTESMLVFENGNRKKKDTLGLEWIFTHQHPECPEIRR